MFNADVGQGQTLRSSNALSLFAEDIWDSPLEVSLRNWISFLPEWSILRNDVCVSYDGVWNETPQKYLKNRSKLVHVNVRDITLKSRENLPKSKA